MSELSSEEVEQIAEVVPEFIESMEGVSKTFAFLVATFTGVSGAAIGYFVATKRLEMKYREIADDEIDEMRQHYMAKSVAMENTVDKPKLEDIVRDHGYSTDAPMVVNPPTEVVEAAEGTKEVLTPKPTPEPKKENVFEKEQATPEEVGDPLVDRNWDYHRERVNRSPLRPYVIHRDEKDENEALETVTFTYYEEDDVLCNERDEVIGKDERDKLIGESNLGKFGHGSGDPSIVYIRNDKLELQVEVVRSPNSFAEEVHGFQHSDEQARRYRRERWSSDDE